MLKENKKLTTPIITSTYHGNILLSISIVKGNCY